MLRLIKLPLWLLLVTSCIREGHPTTIAEHERAARQYDATADSIEHECWKNLRHELTVDPKGTWCWKQEDIRFLEANRDAATEHRAEAARLRALSASR